jgi:cytochrome c peroxidase
MSSRIFFAVSPPRTEFQVEPSHASDRESRFNINRSNTSKIITHQHYSPSTLNRYMLSIMKITCLAVLSLCLANSHAFSVISKGPSSPRLKSTALNNFMPGGGAAPWKTSSGTTDGAGIGSWASSLGTSNGGSSAVACSGPVDYDAVRADLKLIMDNPSWDDGSLAPFLLRLAWHSSGTYDAAANTGGSNGAGMRFPTEAADPENAGLEIARSFLEPIKNKHPGISYSDLWILASYVGLEHTGGPVIEFQSGRTDHADESYWAEKDMAYGRLPAAEKYLCPHIAGTLIGDSLDETGKVKGWEGLCSHVRNEVFYRMGFNDQEIVALLCGGHVYGRCHPNFSGYAGPWVEHPTKFSNEYATDLLEDDWTFVGHEDTWLDEYGAEELRPAPGNRQFVNKVLGRVDDEPNQMMLPTDMIIAWDPNFRVHLEVYAANEAKLKEDFGNVFKKLTELGCGF